MSQKTIKITLLSLLLLAVILLIGPWAISRSVGELAVANTFDMLPPELQSQVEIREYTIDSGGFSR